MKKGSFILPTVMSAKEPLIQPRRSASAEAAFRAELQRTEQMTVEQRVKAALSMRGRSAAYQAVSKTK